MMRFVPHPLGKFGGEFRDVFASFNARGRMFIAVLRSRESSFMLPRVLRRKKMTLHTRNDKSFFFFFYLYISFQL